MYKHSLILIELQLPPIWGELGQAACSDEKDNYSTCMIIRISGNNAQWQYIEIDVGMYKTINCKQIKYKLYEGKLIKNGLILSKSIPVPLKVTIVVKNQTKERAVLI
jgi:hypothetical protein